MTNTNIIDDLVLDELKSFNAKNVSISIVANS